MATTTPLGPAAAAHGLTDHGQIAGQHLREVDAVLARVTPRHRGVLVGLGAAEGAAGFGGPALSATALVAGIPAMQAASLRAVADVSRHAGFDPSDFGERRFAAEVALRSLDPGEGQETTAHHAVQLAHQIARTQTWDQISQLAIVGALKDQAARVGISVSRRRLALLLPAVGAAIGASFNAIHARRLLAGATMLYRARHLARRHDAELTEVVGRPAT